MNTMKDKKAYKRRMIADLEERRMLANYLSECKDLGSRLETPEEKIKRQKRIEQEKKHKEKYSFK